MKNLVGALAVLAFGATIVLLVFAHQDSTQVSTSSVPVSAVSNTAPRPIGSRARPAVPPPPVSAYGPHTASVRARSTGSSSTAHHGSEQNSSTSGSSAGSSDATGTSGTAQPAGAGSGPVQPQPDLSGLDNASANLANSLAAPPCASSQYGCQGNYEPTPQVPSGAALSSDPYQRAYQEMAPGANSLANEVRGSAAPPCYLNGTEGCPP